jgi:ADP-glucose pyrophosphorylase
MAGSVFEEDWQSAFALVETGARVAPSAHVHNAVVLSGAVVERDATVVRSIICNGATVAAGQSVIDDIRASNTPSNG